MNKPKRQLESVPPLHQLSEEGWSIYSLPGTKLTFDFSHGQLIVLAADSDSESDLAVPVLRTFVAYDAKIEPAMPQLRLVNKLLTPHRERYYVYEQLFCVLPPIIGPTRRELFLQAREARREARRMSLETAWAAS